MNNKILASIPKGRVAVGVPNIGLTLEVTLFKTLFGGVALVAAGFSAVWYGLLLQQTRRDERGIYAPWEYRILQAQEAAGNPAKPTMSRQSHGTTASHPDRPAPDILSTHPQSESDLGPESSQARADRAVPDAPQTKSGASADSNSGPRPGPEPTPQRTRDDGRVYTKAPRYA